MFLQGSQWPFGSFSVFFDLGVLDELFGMFVDAKVGQVNEPFAYVFGLGVVLVGGKSSKSLFKHIYAQRVIASHHNVNPQIVLKIINQMRIAYILRHQVVLLVANLSVFSHHLYATPASLVCRLHYPEFAFLGCLAGHLKTVKVRREKVSVRNKVVGLRTTSSLFIEIFPHVVLAT